MGRGGKIYNIWAHGPLMSLRSGCALGLRLRVWQVGDMKHSAL